MPHILVLTALPDDTAAAYAAELAQLGAAITAYRSAESTGAGTTTTSRPPTLVTVPTAHRS